MNSVNCRKSPVTFLAEVVGCFATVDALLLESRVIAVVCHSQVDWSGLFSILGSGRKARWLCVLYAYLDETGMHGTSLSCIVAGHFGTKEQWEEFDGKWEAGLGKRKSLHMKELRWNAQPERIAKLLSTLGPIPGECGLKRMFGTVRGDDYLDLIPKYTNFLEICNPFMLALYPAVLCVLDSTPKDERILFVFEQNRQCESLPYPEDSLSKGNKYRTSTGEPRAIFSSIPKGSTPRTEPADYLAFELAQQELDPQSDRAQLGLSILGDRKMVGEKMPKAVMRSLVANAFQVAEQLTREREKRKQEIHALIEQSKKR